MSSHSVGEGASGLSQRTRRVAALLQSLTVGLVAAALVVGFVRGSMVAQEEPQAGAASLAASVAQPLEGVVVDDMQTVAAPAVAWWFVSLALRHGPAIAKWGWVRQAWLSTSQLMRAGACKTLRKLGSPVGRSALCRGT